MQIYKNEITPPYIKNLNQKSKKIMFYKFYFTISEAFSAGISDLNSFPIYFSP